MIKWATFNFSFKIDKLSKNQMLGIDEICNMRKILTSTIPPAISQDVSLQNVNNWKENININIHWFPISTMLGFKDMQISLTQQKCKNS